ncbi:LPXTG cell wall anchor domain-containing protein, partial [Marvinbryantia sp.]
SETEETETPASETEETETPGSETERTSGPAAGNSTRPGKNGSTGKASPKTGDDSDIWMWIALMCISGAGIAVILTRRKRRA